MTAKDITLDLVIRYGFQVLGAIIILTVGVLLARWVGNFTNRWLEPRVKEPPMRLLMVRAIRILVLILALLVALDKFGFQIAPLVAAVGVAGVGVGFAFQGVLANIVAGLSIIFTKPYRVGEYIELLGVHGQVVAVELFSTTLVQLDQSRVDRGRERLSPSPPSEPCVRFSRTRLSGRWFPHRDWLANTWIALMVNNPCAAKRH